MPRTARELTDPYISTLTPPPRAGARVCDVCHGPTGTGFVRCLSCNRTTRQVSRPVTLVVPISLYVVPSQLHHVLRSYKDAPVAATRRELRARVAALLLRFLSRHGDCICAAASSGWGVLTTVPSSRERGGTHPLEQAIQMAPALRDRHERLLRPGQGGLDHNRASDQGFEVARDVEAERILLVDDTFTSGARIQSAASALQLAGATVVAGVIVGRVIDPTFRQESQAFWDAARDERFTFRALLPRAVVRTAPTPRPDRR